MSGQYGRAPAGDEAARLELALARIAKAASRQPGHTQGSANGGAQGRAVVPGGIPAPLHDAAGAVTNGGTGMARGRDTAEIATRLDGLIAELRTLLRGQDIG